MPVSISGTTGYAGPLGTITVGTTALEANAVTPAKMSRTGTSGQVLTSGGAGADPSYTTLPTSVTSFIGQTGAVDPTVTGAIGSIVDGFYTVTTPTASYGTQRLVSYNVGTTIAGSSLAYNFSIVLAASSGTVAVTPGGSMTRTLLGNATSFGFPSSGAAGASYYFVTSSGGSGYSTAVNGTCSYSTLSGSWRSLSPVYAKTYNDGCNSFGQWANGLWQRYA